jgi:hypothetical protein
MQLFRCTHFCQGHLCSLYSSSMLQFSQFCILDIMVAAVPAKPGIRPQTLIFAVSELSPSTGILLCCNLYGHSARVVVFVLFVSPPMCDLVLLAHSVVVF